MTTDSGRVGVPDQRAAFTRAREVILEVLAGAGASQAERDRVAVVLAELSAAIEGSLCMVCGEPITAHDARRAHDCAIELRGRGGRIQAPATKRCTVLDGRGGPRCTNGIAPDKLSVCAGPHAFEAWTPEQIEAARLGAEAPVRKLALVRAPPRTERRDADEFPAGTNAGPGEPR